MNYRVINGLLKQLNGSGFSFNFENDNVYVQTDSKTYNLNKIPCTRQNNGNYVFTAEDATFTVSYSKVWDSEFLKRKITMHFDKPATLLKIGFNVPHSQFDDIFLYKVFYNASGIIFARKNKLGLAMGFENPFYTLGGDKIEFEPSLCLKADECFDCDDMFFGIYSLRGEGVRPSLEKSMININDRYQPRYRCPGEGISLCPGEIDEVNKYTKHYFKTENKEFLFMSNNYFSNLPIKPKTDEEIEVYKTHIRNFAKLGGDTIILNPLCDYKMPTEDPSSYWELFPENTPAWDIYQTALQNGLNVGVYMGVPAGISSSNSPYENYADVKEWKKTDIKGNISEENCLGSDEFQSWYLEVTKNTIRKYNLKIWSWDPGPGNAFFCYSKDHGHLPGKGNYKGFRNNLKIMRELKQEFPGLYIQSYHGNKEYGLWGYKYTDQHEGCWGYDIQKMNPIFHDISPDRLTADIVRYQSNINYLFRFMPFAIGYGATHRIYQNCHDGQLDCDLLFDRNGYKFALLSAVAASGSVTIPIIPRKPELIPGYIDFYKEVISFARENFDYSKNTILFNNLENYGGEAYAKLLDNEGFIFIVNPYPMPINFSFILNETIGFNPSNHQKNINFRWPMKADYVEGAEYGERISLIIPPLSIPVLEITHKKTNQNIKNMTRGLPRFLNLTKKTRKGFIYKFFGDNLIKQYIDEQQQYIYQEVLDAGEKFCEYKNSVGDHWFKPDRLYLHILNTEYKPNIKLNNLILDLKPMELNYRNETATAGYFVDITNMMIWNNNNIIEVEGNEEPWLFLSYPRPETELPSEITHDIIRAAPFAPKLDRNVVVLEASLNNDNVMVQNQTNIIKCKINLPYEELEGVYASMPVGDGIYKDMPLNYCENKIWQKSFEMGSRKKLVIDDEKIVIWAVTKDNRESDGYELKIDWIL